MDKSQRKKYEKRDKSAWDEKWVNTLNRRGNKNGGYDVESELKDPKTGQYIIRHN